MKVIGIDHGKDDDLTTVAQGEWRDGALVIERVFQVHNGTQNEPLAHNPEFNVPTPKERER